jgi:hypothetical protein|tara:strand:- start:596 stop:703 length:108 start_codon:yes stop_codon:yes gene_type:complete
MTGYIEILVALIAVAAAVEFAQDYFSRRNQNDQDC